MTERTWSFSTPASIDFAHEVPDRAILDLDVGQPISSPRSAISSPVSG